MSRHKSRKARSARERAEGASPQPAASERSRLDWPLAAIAVAGLVLTAILIAARGAQDGLPYCNAGSGCDVVQGSAWSRFLGVPLAVWGFGAYLALGVIACDRRAARRWRLAAFVASFGFGLSAYLTAVSGLAIGAWCVYCLASAALMTAAFALTFRRRAPVPAVRMRVAGLFVAAVVAAVMHAGAAGVGAGAGDPALVALARHLEARGAKFYGASWCPHCQEQKALFGAAAAYLPYVECSPHGPRTPQATACAVKEISKYPTWIIDGRRIERILTTDLLAKLSAFEGAGAAAGE